MEASNCIDPEKHLPTIDLVRKTSDARGANDKSRKSSDHGLVDLVMLGLVVMSEVSIGSLMLRARGLEGEAPVFVILILDLILDI